MVKNNWNFHNVAISTGNGNEYKIKNEGNSTTATVSIYGTSTTWILQFEAKGLLGDYVALKGYDVTNTTMASSATETSGKLWQFDLTGLSYFRVRIQALNANLSVFGKVVE